MIDLSKIPISKRDETPHRFFFYGPSMVGKSTLSQRFPKPLVVSTDGNGRFNTVRTVSVTNWTQVKEVVESFAAQEGPVEGWVAQTLIIDLVDDIVPMIQNYARLQYNKEFGKSEKKFGWSTDYGKMTTIYTNEWNWLRDRIKLGDGYVIFISYSRERKLDGQENPTLVPNLREKDTNTVLGICDVVIKLDFAGNSRIAVSERNRASSIRGYTRSEVNPDIVRALDKVSGLWNQQK